MHHLRFISSLLIFLLMFNLLVLSPSVEGLSNNDVNRLRYIHVKDDGVVLVGYKHNRKVLAELDATLDYDYAGANPRHDPRGKRGGGSGKNP